MIGMPINKGQAYSPINDGPFGFYNHYHCGMEMVLHNAAVFKHHHNGFKGQAYSPINDGPSTSILQSLLPLKFYQ